MKEQIVEELGKEIKNKSTMSEEYKGKVHRRILSNILIAIAILAYLILIILGSEKIESDMFVVYLKTASIVLSLLSIIIFEKSYRAADGKLCIYGIEILFLAILTLVNAYIFQIIKDSFPFLIVSIAIIVPIYYLVKSIIIFIRSKNAYKNSQNDIKEIVKEELPETKETKKRRNILEVQMEEYNRLNNETEEDLNKHLTEIKTSTIKEAEKTEAKDKEMVDDYRERVNKPRKTTKKATTKNEAEDAIEDKSSEVVVKPKTTKKTTTKEKNEVKEYKTEAKSTTKKSELTNKKTTSTTNKTTETQKKATAKKPTSNKEETSKTEETKPKTTRKTTKKSTTTSENN